MASSGKKSKKSKGKTVPLTDFLQETPGPAPSIPIRKSGLNWAEEVEDTYDNYDSSRGKQQAVILPTAPKAARGIDDYSDKIPQHGPFIAYLSNLPYDVDEDEIAEFFGDLKILNMKIPKDDRPGETPKLKGFGYVEFEDRECLLGALSIPDCTLKSRRIRIEVATNSENDRRRGGRMDMNRDRQEVSMGDWRSGPRVPESDSDNRRKGGFSRDRERDAPIERSSGGGGGGGGSSGAWRDSSNFRENRDFERNDKGHFDRDGGERRGFGPSRRDDRNGGFSRNRDEIPSERSELRMRPKLNLAPRTKPIEDLPQPVKDSSEPAKVTVNAVPTASIFGNAKPVDTSARERQIEERLAKEQVKTSDSNVEKRDVKKEDDRRRRDDEIRRSPRRSPERKYSPRRPSPDRRSSPDRNRSSDRPRYSPERRRNSPERRRNSPERRRNSPERRRISPDRNRGPPLPRRNDDNKRGPRKEEKIPAPKDKIEKVEKPKKDDKPAREYAEREMPKLKEPEPQNFVTSNKYSYLEAEDSN